MFDVKNDTFPNCVGRVEMLFEVFKVPPLCSIGNCFPSRNGRFSVWVLPFRFVQDRYSEHYHLLEHLAIREVVGGGPKN